ncbi:SDR family oxidoreductase [Phreatobacter stygius]|uniref:SDR family oxidoreductase n=1 Tax=Phreatobacter stygius TaxID=1940610 RepID=A0A4D7B6L5_9HYPH|nr:SDR family oxidoreductase [Phreatobacter stygius]QCI66018.1 SDR family oxidoreductase [Phreatobacter stygius]
MKVAKVVLVTGASSGIGRAAAAMLHDRGHIVYGTSRDPERHPAAWRMIRLDVADDSSVAAAMATILAEQSRIDAVVNNAGLVLAGAVEDTTLAEARQLFETNLFGALRVTRAALPAMRAQRAGVIVNIGSLAGRVGLPFQGLYSASKFALEGLSESLRLEVAGFGVQVTLVAPGDTATSVVDNRQRTEASGLEASAYAGVFPRVLATFEAEERAGSPAVGVARRIADIVEGRATAPRYVVGPLAQRILVAGRAFIPARLFQWGLGIYYRLRP